LLSPALQITDCGLNFFFSVNKHLSNNEQTDNVLREKKNILFLFFFFAVSSENYLDLETHVGRPEYESWRFLFVVGVGFAY